jgi:DNA-binding XRE family transcriptional regulator
MKKQNLIYSLVCPFTNETHYVGKTTQGMLRPMKHLNKSHSEKIKEWVGNLKDLNHSPVINILEYVEQKEDLDSKERQWIQHYLTSGSILLNTQLVTPKMIKNNIDDLLNNDNGNSMSRISKFVKMKRKSFKLTQAEFADKLGIALTVIRKIEQGKTNVSLESLLQILLMFDCSIGVVKMKND